MKFTVEIETQSMSFDILDDLIDLLQNDGLRKELEYTIKDYLEDLLICRGTKDVAVQVKLS